MRVYYNYYKVVLLLIIACFFITSCANDNESDQRYSPSSVDVAFSVTLPVPEEVQSGTSRAFADTDIKNVTLLIFDNNKKFLERMDIDETDLNVVAGNIKFTVRLDASPNSRTIHMIANARTADGLTDRIDFSGLVPNETEANIIPALKTNNITGTGEDVLLNNIMPLVMWGRANLPNISIVSKVEGVKLLRAAACIKVKKKENTPALDAFEILGITVHEGAQMGYVAPASYLSEATTPDNPNALDISTHLNANNCWSMEATPSLYVYEHSVAKSHKGLSLIIKANYRTKEGYYKIVLAKGAQQLDIVRNHRYTLTVVGVDDRGYSDLQTAIDSPASNIKVEIIDDDEDYPFIQADSEDWIGASHNRLEVYGRTGMNQAVSCEIEICTVFSSRGIAPTCEVSANWLRNPKVELISGETNKYRVTVESLVDVSGSAPYIGALITIRCENLSHAINAKWTKEIPDVSGNQHWYIFDLLNGGPTEYKSWMASIPNPSVNANVRLHPTSTAPSPADGCVTSLTSKYAPNAYLHVEKSTNRIDEVHMSYTTAQGAIPTVSRIIIAQ